MRKLQSGKAAAWHDVVDMEMEKGVVVTSAERSYLSLLIGGKGRRYIQPNLLANTNTNGSSCFWPCHACTETVERSSSSKSVHVQL